MNDNRLHELFTAIDRMDASAFAQFITPNGSFRFGNFPPVVGREAIEETVRNFFQSIKGLRHQLSDVIREKDKVVITGQVTYTRHNQTTITVPFCNVFTLEDNLISQYDIYIDISQLYQ